jgi:lipoate-protein ligase B
MVSLLADLGVAAHLRAGAPGVWAGDAKIGSVGVHVRRGVSLHGAALNLDLDLSPFELFVPCGLSGVRMTSVAAVRGRSPSAQDVAELACQHVLWSLLAASVDGGAATR